MPLLYLAQLLFQAKLCFLLNNFSAVVVTAVTANPVRCLILSALRAFHKGRSAKLPHVRTSLILSGTGNLSLRNCHDNLLYVLKSDFLFYRFFFRSSSSFAKPAIRGSISFLPQVQEPSFRS